MKGKIEIPRDVRISKGQGISSDVMVYFICKGLLELWETRVENNKMIFVHIWIWTELDIKHLYVTAMVMASMKKMKYKAYICFQHDKAVHAHCQCPIR